MNPLQLNLAAATTFISSAENARIEAGPLPTYDELVLKYRQLADAELCRLAADGPDAFTSEAWRALKREVQQRGLPMPVPSRPGPTVLDDPLNAAAETLTKAATPLTHPETYKLLVKHLLLSALYAVPLAIALYFSGVVKGYSLNFGDLIEFLLGVWGLLLIIPVLRWFKRSGLFDRTQAPPDGRVEEDRSQQRWDSQLGPFKREAQNMSVVESGQQPQTLRDSSHSETVSSRIPKDRELETILLGDEFVGQMCLVCGMHAALFVVQGGHVGLCPKCVADRISRLREGAPSLPEWITVLEQEATREERHQRRKQDREFELRWDDMYKCNRCDRLIHKRDARYYFEPGSSSSPPYCQNCYNTLSERPRM